MYITMPMLNRMETTAQITLTEHSVSAHDTSLITALDAGKAIGLRLPQNIDIFAVEVENVMGFSDAPTPTVAEAIPKVTEMVLEKLNLPSALS